MTQIDAAVAVSGCNCYPRHVSACMVLYGSMALYGSVRYRYLLYQWGLFNHRTKQKDKLKPADNIITYTYYLVTRIAYYRQLFRR